ncbi:glutathione S-transferase T2-like [Capsella rubella]|uniref:glutathione S-transferase T2-like n=1 Tax=Capsella rubella TaxID=81985 RepID=UPI000CD58904|nr:glutathione S-transferase T2-like [Capsella rubella]
MDPTNPYSQNSSFVNLLSSQQEGQFFNLNEYESFSPSVEPVFSTQSTDQPSPAVEDPKIQSLGMSKGLRLSGRGFKHTLTQVCYEAAMKEQSSGQNHNDVMKAANRIFFNDHGVKFTLEHAWRELRHDQKWCSSFSGKDVGRSKRRKVDAQEGGAECAQEDVDAEVVARPQGVKAAKALGKKKTTSAKEDDKDMVEFLNMWEIKKKELEMKDKLCNKKMLDTLLAKSEPLSDIEMALRNKLINDMMS